MTIASSGTPSGSGATPSPVTSTAGPISVPFGWSRFRNYLGIGWNASLNYARNHPRTVLTTVAILMAFGVGRCSVDRKDDRGREFIDFDRKTFDSKGVLIDGTPFIYRER